MSWFDDVVRRHLGRLGLERHVVDMNLHRRLIYNKDLDGDRTGTTFTYDAALIEDSVQLKLRRLDLRPGVDYATSITDGVTTFDLASGTSPRGAPGEDGEFYIAFAEVRPVTETPA